MNKQADHFEQAEQLLRHADPQITGSVTASLDSAKVHALLALNERLEALIYLFASAAEE